MQKVNLLRQCVCEYGLNMMKGGTNVYNCTGMWEKAIRLFEDLSPAEHIVSTRAMWLKADDKAGI